MGLSCDQNAVPLVVHSEILLDPVDVDWDSAVVRSKRRSIVYNLAYQVAVAACAKYYTATERLDLKLVSTRSVPETNNHPRTGLRADCLETSAEMGIDKGSSF